MTTRPSAQQRRDREAAAQAAAFVRSAVGFTAHFRVGPHEAHTVPATTLGEARERAAELNAKHGRFGRRAIVYAIDARGGQVPIPDSVPAPEGL